MALQLERHKEDALIAVLEQRYIIIGKSARERRRIRLATSVRTKNEILLCFTFKTSTSATTELVKLLVSGFSFKLMSPFTI